MTRRSFLTALSAVLIVPTPQRIRCDMVRYGSTTWYALHGTEAVIAPHQAHLFAVRDAVEDRLFLNGPEMKRWLNDQAMLAIQKNPDGIRHRG